MCAYVCVSVCVFECVYVYVVAFLCFYFLCMKATMNIIFTMIEERLSLISQPMKRNLLFSFQNMKKLSEIVLKYIRHLFVLKILTTGSFCLACFTGWSL